MFILQLLDILVSELSQMALIHPPFWVVMVIHLHRDYLKPVFLLLTVSCHGIFHPHDVISLFLQTWGDCHGEQRAFGKCQFNILVILLSGNQVFIVPDGNIPEVIILMDQPHQTLGMCPVFFSVTEEDIRIKCIPYPLRRFIPNQHGFQVGLQNIFVRGGCWIIHDTVHNLDGDLCCLVKFPCQPRLHHDGENRDVVLIGIRQDNIPRPVWRMDHL